MTAKHGGSDYVAIDVPSDPLDVADYQCCGQLAATVLLPLNSECAPDGGQDHAAGLTVCRA
jgi:hypothetical protein